MDLSEISFIERFHEALSQVDFDVLIKDILIFEQSFEKECRTDSKTPITGQKRTWNLKSERMKPTACSTSGSGSINKKPACITKLDKAVHVSEDQILTKDRSKSCQTSLFIKGDLVDEFPESKMESKSDFSRYKDVSKQHKQIKTYSAKYRKGKHKTGSGFIESTNIASTISSQSGSRDIGVKNIASTISSQSGWRDIEVKNIASTISSQSESRDNKVKNIASTISSQSGSRDIEVKNIALTNISKSGSSGIEVKNIASTISSQSGIQGIEANNIASTSNSQTGLLREIQKPPKTHHRTVQKTLVGNYRKKVLKDDKNSDTAYANKANHSNGLEVHTAPKAITSGDTTLSIVAPTSIENGDLALSIVAPTTIKSDNLALSVISPTKINSELNLPIVAPTAINSDNMKLSIVAPTAINSDNMKLSIVASPAINCDDMKLSIVASTAINSDDLSLSTLTPTLFNSDDLSLSTLTPTLFNSDDLSLSTLTPTLFNSDDLALSLVPKFSIFSNETDVKNQECQTTTKFKSEQSSLELIPEFQHRNEFLKSPSFMSETRQTTCSLYEVKDDTLNAKKISSNPEISKEYKTLDDHVMSSNGNKEPKRSKIECEFACKQTLTTAETFILKTTKENNERENNEQIPLAAMLGFNETIGSSSFAIETQNLNKIENNEEIPVAVMLGFNETIGPSAVAMETQNLRDIAFPGSLCFILYEDLSKQVSGRAELESIAINLEQAQEKCFTLAPRTPEERKILLESQRQERLTRSLKVQNGNLDKLTQQIFVIIINFMEIKVVETVKFAKCIPGFKTLDIADQITLIKGFTSFPLPPTLYKNEICKSGIATHRKHSLPSQRKDAHLINLTPHACRVINSETQMVTYLPGLHIGFEEFCEKFSEEIKELLKEAEMKGNQLNITAREEALLQAIFLVSIYDKNSLQNPDKVEDIYRKLVSCLLHVVSTGPLPVFQRMDQLSDMILFGRRLRDNHFRFMLPQIMNFSKDNNDLTIHEIYEKYM